MKFDTDEDPRTEREIRVSQCWHVASMGNHQGLIVSETGENIAVAYDKANAPRICDCVNACADMRHPIADVVCLRQSLENCADMLEEAHRQDVEDDHGGDGPEGCSYCEAIANARANIARTEGGAK